MNVTLSPSNHTSKVVMNVIGYVGEGNRSTHGSHEVYAIVKKEIEMRAMRLIPINVTVSNDANVSITGVNVSFYARGPNDADYISIGNSTITAVNAKGSADTGVQWDATWADRAVYTIKAVVDPTHQHADSFEENNVLFFRVNLGDPEPNVQQGHIGQAFLIGTLAVIAIIGVGLWWYNRVYE
jgi:subtilase family serine protease